MNRFLCRIQKWRFDKKMRVFVSLSIGLTTTFILIASAVLFWLISVDNSRKTTEYQLSIMADNFAADFNRYKDMAVALTLNSSVQEYLSFPRKENAKRYYTYASLATEMLLGTCNLNPNVYAIAVMNNQENDFIIKLHNSRYLSSFKSVYKNDLSQSLPLGSKMLRLTYNNAYTRSDIKTLNIYFPLYSVNIINKQLGNMCISLSNDQLFQLSHLPAGENDSCLYFLDSHGTILAAADTSVNKMPFPCFNRITNESGSFWVSRNLYIYRSIRGWGYYLVQKIPKNALFVNSVHIFLLLMIVIFLMVAAGIFFSDKIVTIAYHPLNKILKAMDLVRADKLGMRIDKTRLGDDFASLAAGFNKMMDEIEHLVLQIKQDQQEKSRIQLNALQSQIQPHFLYNTLECIHWQALADGNREVAKLGMALASYYRLCLSGGKDIIPLRQELQHVKNYLLIENMRYGNIIESEISVGQELFKVQIPKISLQPLVENAIKYGARLKEGIKAYLKITAEKTIYGVYIYIVNDGNGISEQEITRITGLLSQTAADSPGYGIRNVHRRIQLFFGTEYGLSFSSNTFGGITVCVHIPYTSAASGEGVPDDV
jgi:two-component system sensor histidine kinase YesM